MSSITSKTAHNSNFAPSATRPLGFLSFTLHAHLPYVINHGTWPHGIEWLLEAAAETYLPLLRVFSNLEREGIALHCNLNLSPILLEQLTHPVFKTEFPRYLERKIHAAREDESYFRYCGGPDYTSITRFWQEYFSTALHQFEALQQNIVQGFREFNDKGLIDILTCPATHGYLPLLGSDESVRAQIRTAVAVHQRHFGKPPRGIWIPECGYRPAGLWSYPIPGANGAPFAPAFDRIGVEQALRESGLDFFLVDAHLVDESARTASPYFLLNGRIARRLDPPPPIAGIQRLYRPYFVAGPYLSHNQQQPTAVFPRDPGSGIQVWSGEFGYPADNNYLDFHKKRWPGGHRYWSVTGPGVNIDDKQPYDPARAAERIRSHAAHFVHLAWDALSPALHNDAPPILSSPFDAELFGHWWFEGPLWLEAVARTLHKHPIGLQLTSHSSYLQHYPPTSFIQMREGSWGAEGTNTVWLNPTTSWTYEQLYPAELYLRELCSTDLWKDGDLGERIVKQLCRELLLLESSDWQFLITTGAARDYAELRFRTHLESFTDLKSIWQHFASHHAISAEQQTRLAAIEEADSVFAHIDPSLWAAGSRRQPPHEPTGPHHPPAPSLTDPALEPASNPGRLPLPRSSL
ncbi:MAG: glycoside hydrolase family 57 protein [Acidobacteriaceae bacterium]